MIDNEYQKHTGTERPAELAAAQIVEVVKGELERADEVLWEKMKVAAALDGEDMHYRPALDPDGIPYCSAEGLEPWAEYVATDDLYDNGQDGDVGQFSDKPVLGFYADRYEWNPDLAYTGAPETHRKPGHPANSLMRVWR